MAMSKKLAYGTYGGLFGIGHVSDKLDQNPGTKAVAKETVKASKSLLKTIPHKIIKMSKQAKEWG